MMQMIKISTGLFFYFIFSIGLYAQQDSVLNLSLENAREHAVRHNLNIQNASLEVEIAKKKVWETTAMGLPQISASGSYVNNLNLSTQLFPNFIEPTIVQTLVQYGMLDQSALSQLGDPQMIEVKFGTQHNLTGSARVDQLVFSGPYIVGLQASKVYKELSQRSLEKTKNEIKAAVVELYYLILLTENNEKILEHNLQNLQNTIDEAEAMYKNGFTEETEVDRLKVSLNTLKNQLNTTKRQVKMNYDLLKIQLGASQHTRVNLTQSLDEIIKETAMEGVANQSFEPENNISYQLAETQEKLSELDMKREKSNYLPSLNAFYSMQENAMRDEFNFFDSEQKWFYADMFGLSLNVPIFSSGMKRSKVSQAKIKLEQSKNDRELLRQNLTNHYIQACNSFQTALGNYYTTEENKKLAKKILERTTIKHKTGTASSMEFNQANDKYLQAESAYVSAVVQLLNAKTQIDKIKNNL